MRWTENPSLQVLPELTKCFLNSQLRKIVVQIYTKKIIFRTVIQKNISYTFSLATRECEILFTLKIIFSSDYWWCNSGHTNISSVASAANWSLRFAVFRRQHPSYEGCTVLLGKDLYLRFWLSDHWQGCQKRVIHLFVNSLIVDLSYGRNYLTFLWNIIVVKNWRGN